LIITVDCGISGVEEVEYAKSLGIDVILTDHHLPSSLIPDAVAVIDPQQEDCGYPFGMLAGVGVAFKLACALIPDLPDHDDFIDFLEIVSLGSIADIAPIYDENRTIAYHGLKNMNKSNMIGLRSLVNESGLQDKKITSGDIGFKLAPQLNATGRIGQADLAVELLMSDDLNESTFISKQLKELNEERQEIERRIVAEAIEIIESDPSYEDDKFLIVASEGWHTGILGIATSKICDKYYKPTILLDVEDGMCKGSGRSIDGFDLHKAVDSIRELTSSFGGHEQACGMAIKLENVDEFRKQINLYTDSVLTEEDMIPKLKYECVIDEDVIDFNLMKELAWLEPHGVGNARPMFRINDMKILDSRTIGKDSNHVKLKVLQGVKEFDAIMFNSEMTEELTIGNRIDMIVTLDVNEFRGRKSIQFMLKDYKNTIDN